MDIQRRYRRSTLGPLWLTLSMGITVGALGFVWGTLFDREASEFIPFLAIGLILWGFIASMLSEACTVFINAEGIVKEIRLPFITYVLRLITSNAIIMGHNAVIIIVVFWLFGRSLDMVALAAIPGVILLAINSIWVGLLFGILNTRYRDIQPVVTSLLTPIFLVTPIIWQPSILPERALFLDANPFFAVIEVIRGPLLGHMPHPLTWTMAILVPLIGACLAFTLFVRYRWRIAYWL